jgi:hypothetical protein
VGNFSDRQWGISVIRSTEGKTKKEALRSLKRQVSNAVYRQLLLDAQ